jgi:hypothetical protein
MTRAKNKNAELSKENGVAVAKHNLASADVIHLRLHLLLLHPWCSTHKNPLPLTEEPEKP